MKIVQKTIEALLFRWEDLSDRQKRLLMDAAKVRLNAQAPYSHYYVGVAILSKNGTTYRGCNVERASYTQTTHAEQNAIDAMITKEGPQKIEMLTLIAAPKTVCITLPPPYKASKLSKMDIKNIPVPCGHCLQIIWENCFNDPTVPLISLTGNGLITITTIGNALPMRFGPETLGIDYSKK